MKKTIFTLICILGMMIGFSQSHCIDVSVTNGLGYEEDSISLGGSVHKETTLSVVSESFKIIGSDSIGYYLYVDEGKYAVFIGNPFKQQGINVYDDVVNIAAFDELNIYSDYYRLKDRNQVKYVVYETGKINFGSEIELFFNTSEYSSNSEALSTGADVGSTYFNTFTNSYSKVLP